MKRIILLSLAVLSCAISAVHGRDSLDRPIPPGVLGQTTPPIRPASDYMAAPGQISAVEAEDLQACLNVMVNLLNQAPNDGTGRLSSLHTAFQAWVIEAEQATASKSQIDVINLIPAAASLLTVDVDDNVVWEGFGSLQKLIEGSAQFILSAMAGYVKDNAGVLPPGLLSKFVTVYAVHGLAPDLDPDDPTVTLEAGGVMIIDAPAVVTELTSGSWERASGFLGGGESPTSFFDKYSTSGDGLAVLKTKYAADQTAIDAKFNELKTWVADNEPEPEQ